MSKATKKCKVCGREYEYCHTNRREKGVFRWQDVACCPQHGQEYLAEIIKSRSPVKPDEEQGNDREEDVHDEEESEDEDNSFDDEE